MARYLGAERTQRAFDGFQSQRTGARGHEADIQHAALRRASHLPRRSVRPSSRLVLSLLLKRRNLSSEAAFKLLDVASAALQHNRDLLQHALDHAGQGITVLDRELRLIAWNRAFIDLYELPDTLVRIGVGIDEIIQFNASRGTYGPGNVQDLVATRIESFMHDREPVRLSLFPSERVIEIRTNELPDGGPCHDLHRHLRGGDVRARAGKRQRDPGAAVNQRTEELTIVNEALKTRQGRGRGGQHLQDALSGGGEPRHSPAAQRGAALCVLAGRGDRKEAKPELAENIDASLEAVEDILTALLDISRLDSGALKPDISSFAIGETMRQLQREFEPVAREKGLEAALRYNHPQPSVRIRRLLRRLLQNLISNAIKYTPEGKVLVGARRRGGKLVHQVLDTGLGIPASKQKIVFREFQRLEEGARVARGLGLGPFHRAAHRADAEARPLACLAARARHGLLHRAPIVAEPALALVPPAEQLPSALTPLAGLSVLANRQ